MKRAATRLCGGERVEEEASLAVDLLRGELYRLLDELARAGPEEQGHLLEALEDTLQRFRGALALRG